MAKKILALFGDSILDNAAYTHPEPDTTAHLERQLGADWTVQRLAQDGAMMHNVGEQLSALRDRPAVAVLSVGGNDAIEHIDILEQPAVTSGTVLEDLEKIGASFHTAYERVARAVAQRAARTIVCTIYEVQLEPPAFAKRVRVPLAVINDRILRVAAKLGLDTLELRSVCTEPADFVQQIEPSAQGAAKIAKAIVDVMRGDGGLSSGRVFAA
jgi:lysophospholipase L1-like esterase